jgi:hypothetical protein
MCSNHRDSVDALREVLASLVSTRAADRGAVGSGERISLLLAARAQLDAVIFDEVAAFDSSGASVDDGASTAASWLRSMTRLGRRDASGLVHQARQLRDLTATAEALRAGSISSEHARQIAKARATSAMDAAGFAPYEAVLVELATKASPDEVKAAVQQLVDLEAPERDKQLLDTLADRSLTIRPVGDLVKVDAVVDKVTAEALVAGVEALSRRAGEDDQRSWHVRRADAFSELILLGLDSGELPLSGRAKPHVALTMTLDQLAGIAGTGPLLKRFGRIPLVSAQRLACDAVLTRFITDPSGEVLDVGRSSRHTNAALGKAVAQMYDTCAYPNCATPVTRCDIHHVHWWSHGGPTDRANLLPLCKHHHLFVHEHGYTIQTSLGRDGTPRSGPQRWTFTSPRGAPIPDHRQTLRATVHQLSLMPDPLDAHAP